MTMRPFQKTVDRLCEISRRGYTNPYEAIEWPESLPPDGLCTSPELISIYGTPTYDALTTEQRAKLSFFEAINFYSLNIAGEKPLVEGLASRLHKKRFESYSPYLHHFLDEENKHMIYFGTFCTKYAGRIYPDKKVPLGRREYAEGEEDFLFFAKVMVFEELVDVFNQRMAKDDRLIPVARHINFLHHQDETRHLVFGRQMVHDLFREYAPKWSPEALASVRETIAGYFSATWREYHNPQIYRDTGLSNAYAIYEEGFDHEASRARRRDVSSSCVKLLMNLEVLLEEPVV